MTVVPFARPQAPSRPTFTPAPGVVVAPLPDGRIRLIAAAPGTDLEPGEIAALITALQASVDGRWTA